MPKPYASYPVLRVMPYGLLVFERREWFNAKPKNKRKSDKNSPNPKKESQSIEDVQYSGQMTSFARKRLKKAIQLMVAISLPKEAIRFKTGKKFMFKVNFVTLTLPAPQGKVTDKELKRFALDNWIKRMRRKRGLKSYVWRAERQKNGNLHFHIITDTYLHYEHIRNDWNACLRRFGYIDAFKSEHGHENPNSTDVHAVWKVKNLVSYFIKYMSKGNDEGDTINGKLWDCSENLKSKDSCEVLLDEDILPYWTKARNLENVRTVDDPNFNITFLDATQFDKIVTGRLRKEWEDYLSRVRDFGKGKSVTA